MRQSLETMMAPITARAKMEKAEEDKAKQPAEKTFHEREIDRMNSDPSNALHQAAVAIGRKNAQDFLDSAMNRHHPQHAKNLETLKEKFKMDPKAAEEDFVSKSTSEMGTHEFEKKDPGYEQNLLKKYRPTGNVTPMKQKMYDNWSEALTEKWNRCGYAGDEAFVRHSASTYCLSANDNDIQLKEFQPRK